MNFTNKFLSVFRIFRLKPFEVSTEGGRADERHRRAALTSLAAVTAKVVSFAAAMITVPMTLHYLGNERYGMWMTMSSIVTMLSFADFGIGNGILSAVARACGENDPAAIRKYVSSGFFILTIIAIVVLLLFALSYSFIPWPKLFNVTDPLAKVESGPAMAAMFLCFAVAIPLSVVQRVQMGLQKGFMANLWSCASSFLMLGGVIVAVKMRAGLSMLVLIYAGSPLVVALLNNIIFFSRVNPETAPKKAAISRDAIGQVFNTGILFFVLQLVAAMIFASDNLIIAQVLDAKTVAEYAVPQKIFAFVSVISGIMLTPLWPAYGEAIACGDRHWVKTTVYRTLTISLLVTGGASLVLVLVAPPLIRLWVGGAIAPSLSLLVGMGVWQVVQAGGSAVAMFLNGANVVKFQVVFALITGIVMIIAKIISAKMIGLSGVVWASSVCYLLLTALPMACYLRWYFKAPASAPSPA